MLCVGGDSFCTPANFLSLNPFAEEATAHSHDANIFFQTVARASNLLFIEWTCEGEIFNFSTHLLGSGLKGWLFPAFTGAICTDEELYACNTHLFWQQMAYARCRLSRVGLRTIRSPQPGSAIVTWWLKFAPYESETAAERECGGYQARESRVGWNGTWNAASAKLEWQRKFALW